MKLHQLDILYWQSSEDGEKCRNNRMFDTKEMHSNSRDSDRNN